MTDRELIEAALEELLLASDYLFQNPRRNNVMADLRARLDQPEPATVECTTCGAEVVRVAGKFDRAEPSEQCWCRDCNDGAQHMIVCPTCGNKRCPHATNHVFACTGSNEPGQIVATNPFEPSEQAAPATVDDNSQLWAGMDGAVAWHLIERHADGWADVGKMMNEWLAANQAAPAWRDLAFATLGVVRDKMAPSDVDAVQRFLRGEYAPVAKAEPVAQVVPCYTPSGKRVALNTAHQHLPIGTHLYLAPPAPDALRESHARLVEALRELESLAGYAMRQANQDGAEYNIDDELADVRAALAAAKEASNG